MFKKVFGNETDQKPLRKLLKCILDIEPKKITILNPEIIGAYDGEWHRKEVERLVRLEQIEKANEEGLAKGIKQGIKQGIEQEKLNILRNMIRENIDINIISKVTGLTIENINSAKTNFE